MPGVNLPWSQVLYYLVTLTISGVFHEFGHAISAVRYDLNFKRSLINFRFCSCKSLGPQYRLISCSFNREQVRVNGFGMFFMLIYPGAFVDLYTEHLTVISPLRQLRIYCAGVWHNAVLVLVGMLLIWCLPYLLVPFYVTGQGAVVFSLLKVSSCF